MSAGKEELLVSLATAPWQPRSLRPKPRESLPLRLRIGLLGAIALLHVLATFLLLALVERNRQAQAEDAIVVDFIDAPPPMPPTPTRLPNETITIHMLPRATPAPRTPVSTPATPPREHPRATQRMQAVETPAPLRLYRPDGRLEVPDDMLDKLDEQFGDKRQFSYQIPHLDDAKKYFDRNTALAYEETRFEKSYRPNRDLLSSLLQKMVDATTKEIKIKVPGSPGSYMVCKVSILALGGGCGVLTNGADWNGPQDDPNTLNEEEQRQCAAWWEQIVGARTQDAWRATRKLYEQSCRKPLLRAPSG